MIRHQCVLGLLLMLGVATTTRGQLLAGDPNFPILNDIQWGASISEVRDACIRRHIKESSTDSAVVLSEPMLGFAARTELQFNQNTKTLKLVQAKFSQPTKTLADSITNYFTRTLGRPPVRTVKEKSLLIVTLRMEIASWRLPTGLVNLVTAMNGESLFDASMVLLPPTKPQNPTGQK